MIVNVKAFPVRQAKLTFEDGSIIEIVVWRVPKPVIGSVHNYKYSLYFGKEGKRIVGFDNERGKGDHCHLDGEEFPYAFKSTDQLLDDFNTEVLKRRKR